MVYKAHIQEQSGEMQTVKEHSENTAALCRKFAVQPMKDLLYTIGLMHDIGKYQSAFQQRINGKKIKVEHSICGAQEIMQRYDNSIGRLMAYCIAGHHSGIPDGGTILDTPDLATLSGRLKRPTEDYQAFQEELAIPELNQQELALFLAEDCNIPQASREEQQKRLIDKYAFWVRYCFSCLVDADSLDTASFCSGENRQKLQSDFTACLKLVDERLASFKCLTQLQQTRASLQNQAFAKCGQDAEIYLMNMPTGSGKTLCSVKFALERAIRQGKKRIIYVIPYNSIINQTAEEFTKLFGNSAQILRHQSTFSYQDINDYDEDYRKASQFSEENWDADFIITTAVQFFESIYANKRRKLRKLHNMADSVLIFDEAHLMPWKYLQPCLEAIAYITRYLNSEAIFLTATMPDFRQLMAKYALPNSRIIDLITDTKHFDAFKKCVYLNLGSLYEEQIIEKAQQYPSSLIVVNTRSQAQRLYRLCDGKKYHLSTYMTARDRQHTIAAIRQDLAKLEEDYPRLEQVPKERRIVVISTSLIEAGVDLDFYTVFRELAGLDNILQAGGRCNREGKRQFAEVFIFCNEDNKTGSENLRSNISKRLLRDYSDISSLECISEYYNILLASQEEEYFAQYTIHHTGCTPGGIPFRQYAEQFELIDSRTVSLVVPQDDASRTLVEQLRLTGKGNERSLQSYTCTLHQHELDDLYRQHVVADFGTGVWCLTNMDYYKPGLGICFEADDYYR